jgi:hypothetical protein
MRSSTAWAVATVVILILFLLGAVVPWITSQLQGLLP